MKRAFTTALAAIGLWSCAFGTAFAQGWPTERRIQWLVGFPAGGSADVITRAIAAQVSKRIDQTIVVENRAGAAGAIAAHTTASSPPDGYLLLTVPAPSLHLAAVPDVGVELDSVAIIGTGPMIFAGPPLPDVPDLKVFIERAKADPTKFNFGSSGVGSAQHIGGELLNERTGMRMTHVAYRGGAQIVNDLLAGHVQAAMMGIGPVAAHIRAGKVRGYAVTSAQRFSALPDIPTMAEAGIPGLELRQWFGVAAPKGVPNDIIKRLNKEINSAINQPEVRALIVQQGIEPANSPPDAFTAIYAEDNRLYKDLAIRFGIKIE